MALQRDHGETYLLVVVEFLDAADDEAVLGLAALEAELRHQVLGPADVLHVERERRVDRDEAAVQLCVLVHWRGKWCLLLSTGGSGISIRHA